MSAQTEKPEPRANAIQAERNDPYKKIDSFESCSYPAWYVKRQRHRYAVRRDMARHSNETAAGIAVVVAMASLLISLILAVFV